MGCPCGYVGTTTGVPQIAADLLQGAKLAALGQKLPSLLSSRTTPLEAALNPGRRLRLAWVGALEGDEQSHAKQSLAERWHVLDSPTEDFDVLPGFDDLD